MKLDARSALPKSAGSLPGCCFSLAISSATLSRTSLVFLHSAPLQRPREDDLGQLVHCRSLYVVGQGQQPYPGVLRRRRVVAREVGSLGAGRHAMDLAVGGRVQPGLYFVRIAQGANAAVTRVVVLD